MVGRDPKTDIALIRVKTDQELFALPLGDSEKVRPGDGWWRSAIPSGSSTRSRPAS